MSHSKKHKRDEFLTLVLRPIVRFCLNYSFQLQDITSALKQVLVEAALEEAKSKGIQLNISRISLRTGVHRRDVARLLQEGSTLTRSRSFLAKVVGQWESDARFRTKNGNPRALLLNDEPGSFNELVSLVSKDLKPAAVLAELEYAGMIRHSRGGVKLVKSAYQDSDVGDILEVFVQDADDLLEAVEENIRGEAEVPNLHVRTEYDNVSRDHLPEIRTWMYNEGSKFHKRVREYISRFDKDINPELRSGAGARVILGSFSHCDTDE